MTAPDVRLHPTDAAELAELLQLLHDWLTSAHDELNTSLTQFIGNHAYGTTQLRQDLNRISFLLDATTSDQLFGTD